MRNSQSLVRASQDSRQGHSPCRNSLVAPHSKLNLRRTKRGHQRQRKSVAMSRPARYPWEQTALSVKEMSLNSQGPKNNPRHGTSADNLVPERHFVAKQGRMFSKHTRSNCHPSFWKADTAASAFIRAVATCEFQPYPLRVRDSKLEWQRSGFNVTRLQYLGLRSPAGAKRRRRGQWSQANRNRKRANVHGPDRYPRLNPPCCLESAQKILINPPLLLPFVESIHTRSTQLYRLAVCVGKNSH